MRYLLGTATTLDVGFCATFIPLYVTRHGDILLAGPSMTMKVLLLMPIAAAISTFAATALLIVSFIQGQVPIKLRVLYTTATLAATFMIWFTLHYNLFGL